MVAQIAALILALAKALPAIERILAMIEQQRRDTKAAELHDAIDAAITQAQAGAPVCPRADCPMLRLRNAPKQGQGSAQAS